MLAVGDKVIKEHWNIIGILKSIDSDDMGKKDKDCCVNPDDFFLVSYPKPTGLEWTAKNLLKKVE